MRLAIGDLWSGRMFAARLKNLKSNPGHFKWYHNMSDLVGDRLTTAMTAVVRIVTRQCEFVAAQRVRRTYQVCSLYSRLYGDATLRTMVSRFESGPYGRCLLRWQNAGKRGIGAMFAAASIFSWDKEQITDEEMQRCADDLKHVTAPSSESENLEFCTHKIHKSEQIINEWEMVIDRDNLKVWRKHAGEYLYEYKVYGSFFDIPARAFFDVQMNIEYRKKWDRRVISLDVVDRDEKTGSEVIHWAMHYPFPMYSRDYVYIRRQHVDPDDGFMILVSKATEHPCCPVDDRFVRVSRYSSTMVVKPHNDLDQNGFDYVLTYFDDPHAMIPSSAYNWWASSGAPDFVEKLHKAAIVLHRQKEDAEDKALQSAATRADLQGVQTTHSHTNAVTNQSTQVPCYA